MSNPSYLERMLDGVQAEWKTLEDFGSFTYGYAAKAEDIGDARFIRITDINKNGTLISDDPKYVDLSKESEKYLLRKNDLLMARTGATFGKTMIFEEDYPAIYAGFLIKLNLDKEIINPKFYWHFAQSDFFWNQANKLVSGGGQPQFNANALKQIQILIPCPENPQKSLAIQAEIVRILDAFTGLTAELTAELTARKKQYNYYRDQLLNFDGCEVEWKPLGEIGEFIRGRRFTKADYVDEGIDAIHYGEIYTRYGVFTRHAYSHVKADMAHSLRYAEPGDLVIAGVGETVEEVGKAVAWLGDGKVAIHDDSYAFRHSLNPKYVSYVMQTDKFIDQKAKHVSRGKLNRLLVNGLEKVRIPIPYPNDAVKSLAQQDRVVSILDKFDTLTNSLSEGLPNEIQLRQKQYGYYRDLLLSFPQPEGRSA